MSAMKRALLALAGATALLSILAGPARATDATSCGYAQGPGGWYKLSDNSGPYSIDGSCTATLLGTGGSVGGSVTVAPYPYAALTPGQHNLAIVAATGLTVPTGATYTVIQAATATVKYTTDGTTAPSSSVGMTLGVGSSLALSGATVIANFRAISATGTLDVEYFK